MRPLGRRGRRATTDGKGRRRGERLPQLANVLYDVWGQGCCLSIGSFGAVIPYDGAFLPHFDMGGGETLPCVSGLPVR